MLFRLTIPRDARLIDAVRHVAERAAQCAGYSAADADRIAASVGQALETVLAREVPDAAHAQEPIEVRFEREGPYLDIFLRYAAAGDDRPVVDGALSGEALRQGMDSVEFGRDGAIAWCRLRRTLPRDKADHQCEVPPT